MENHSVLEILSMNKHQLYELGAYGFNTKDFGTAVDFKLTVPRLSVTVRKDLIYSEYKVIIDKDGKRKYISHLSEDEVVNKLFNAAKSMLSVTHKRTRTKKNPSQIKGYQDVTHLLDVGYSLRRIAKMAHVGLSTVQRIKSTYNVLS